ncbi:hypothetical protein [Actinoplanes sp. NPDC026619]|uniref:hypothetical protein n=1 Tax=Actinoplanes sp. NPDC026619 TaxID=3155798 RepID=UPI0034049984
MTAAPARWVALVGPPAAGKSTLAASLHTVAGGQIFRLRDFAIRCRASGWIHNELFSSRDELGWFGDDTVTGLLDAAVHHRFLDAPLMVFENFPGSDHQLRVLYRAAGRCSADLLLLGVGLDADDQVLSRRRAGRRVCLSCEPDPLGEAHRSAVSAPGHPDRCAVCDGPLRRRRTDQLRVFDARVQRFRRRVGSILSAARDLDLPVRQIDADADVAVCRDAALTALHEFGGADALLR